MIHVNCPTGKLLVLVVLFSCISLCSSRSCIEDDSKDELKNWKPVTQEIKKAAEARYLVDIEKNKWILSVFKDIHKIEATRYRDLSANSYEVEIIAYDKCGKKVKSFVYHIFLNKDEIPQKEGEQQNDDNKPVERVFPLQQISREDSRIRSYNRRNDELDGFVPATEEIQRMVDALKSEVQRYYPAKIGQLGAVAFKREPSWGQPSQEIYHVIIVVVHADNDNLQWETTMRFTRVGGKLTLIKLGPVPSREEIEGQQQKEKNVSAENKNQWQEPDTPADEEIQGLVERLRYKVAERYPRPIDKIEAVKYSRFWDKAHGKDSTFPIEHFVVKIIIHEAGGQKFETEMTFYKTPHHIYLSYVGRPAETKTIAGGGGGGGDRVWSRELPADRRIQMQVESLTNTVQEQYPIGKIDWIKAKCYKYKKDNPKLMEFRVTIYERDGKRVEGAIRKNGAYVSLSV